MLVVETHEHAQLGVGRQLAERRLELGQRRGVQRVARLRAVEAHDLDPVLEPLALQRRHGGHVLYDAEPMKRLLAALPAALVTLLVLAPAALAHDGGEGWWGETNDKVVTNAGFILIVFFPVFVFLMSMLQGALEQRKARRKKIQKSLAREQQYWRGGW